MSRYRIFFQIWRFFSRVIHYHCSLEAYLLSGVSEYMTDCNKFEPQITIGQIFRQRIGQRTIVSPCEAHDNVPQFQRFDKLRVVAHWSFILQTALEALFQIRYHRLQIGLVLVQHILQQISCVISNDDCFTVSARYYYKPRKLIWRLTGDFMQK